MPKTISLVVDDAGNKRYYTDGIMCREDDEPTIIMANGDMYWYIKNDNVEEFNPENPYYDDDDDDDDDNYDEDDDYSLQPSFLHRDNRPAIVKSDGSRYYYKDGYLNRENDEPAVINADGSVEYRLKGLLHRVGGPAIINVDGDVEYRLKGLLHRVGGPAIIHLNGDEEYYQNGEYCRDNDLPTVIRGNGTQEWKNKYGQLHRDNDAAVIHFDGSKEYWYNGKKRSEEFILMNEEEKNQVLEAELEQIRLTSRDPNAWYWNGKLHRDNGPAVVNLGEVSN